MYRFQNKLKFNKGKIKKWNKEEFGNIFEDKAILEGNLERLQKQGMREGLSPELQEEEGRIFTQLESEK